MFELAPPSREAFRPDVAPAGFLISPASARPGWAALCFSAANLSGP